MSDQFLQELSGFSRLLDPSLLLEEPKSIEYWLEDPYYSGQFAWELWDGVKEDVAKIVNGRPQISIISGGIGTGKTRTAEAVVQYLVYWLLCHGSVPMAVGLPKSTTVLIGLFSTKLQKAVDAIYRRLRTNIIATEWFKDHAPPNDQIKRRLEWESLIVSPLPSNVQSAISEDIWLAVCDEANFWTGSTDADPVDRVALALKQRMKSRFDENWMLMFVSSATTWDSYTEKIRGKADLVISRTPWQARGEKFREFFWVEVGDRNSPPKILKPGEKPTRKAIKVPIRYYSEAMEDPYEFLRNRVGIGVTDQRRLYSEKIMHYSWADNRNHEEYLLDDEIPDLKLVDSGELRFIHVDLALTQDWCGIGCGFVKRIEWEESEEGVLEQLQHMVMDFAIRVRAKGELEELDLSMVRGIIYSVMDRVPVCKVTFDGFQSADSIQILRKKGLDASRISVDRTPEPHNLLKRLFVEARITVPYSDILTEELRLLYINEKTGKIDHPRRTADGKPGSKDVADAVAGVVWSAHQVAAGIQVVPNAVELECIVI